MPSHRARLAAAPALAVLAVALAPAPSVAVPPTSEIAELQFSLRAGATTCRAVVDDALHRMRDAERGPHRLRAILEVNPDARAIAARLDAERARGRPLRPLHCVPVLVKDNHQTADRLSTTVGSATMLGFRARRDALVVARLRAAGAVVMGKTNMDEWAHGANGYSSRGGQIRNGRRPTRGPGGSSGGSASAVAAAVVPLATGSDTGGSIQIPAAFNGIVGIRPTLGLISRRGIVPYASFTDTPGPLASTVEDAARALGLLTGVDPADPDTRASRGRFRTDYTRFLDPDGLRGARIGVLHRIYGAPFTGLSSDVDRAFAEARRRMRRAGATVVDLPAVRGPVSRLLDPVKVTASQFPAELNAWLRADGRGAPVDSLSEIMARSERPPLRGRVFVLEGIRSELRGGSLRENLPVSRRARARLRAEVARLMRRHRLDAILYPATGCPAPPLPGLVDRTYRCRGARPPLARGELPGSIAPILSPALGWPALTLPGAAMPGRQRVGLTLLGRPWSEGALIRLGHAFEQAG